MIFTSSYKNLPTLRELGWQETSFVGISRGRFSGVHRYIAELAPTAELLSRYKWAQRNYGGLWLSDVQREYEKKFKRQLMRLDVARFAAELDECVLLCYEDSDQFCHRHFVRQWLNYYGHPCIELFFKSDAE